jgi:hypothetical protein
MEERKFGFEISSTNGEQRLLQCFNSLRSIFTRKRSLLIEIGQTEDCACPVGAIPSGMQVITLKAASSSMHLIFMDALHASGYYSVWEP